MNYFDIQRKLENSQKTLELRPELNALNKAKEQNYQLKKIIALLIFMGLVVLFYLTLPVKYL